MPNFEDLPLDVVREVIDMEAHIGKGGLRKLRLVSRNLNALASPVLFAEIILAFLDADEEIAPDCLRCQEIIIALATHSTQVFENTKRLFFFTRALSWAEESKREGVTESKNIVVQNIFDAISALKNLQIIQYFYDPKYDPEQLANEVIRALSTLPSFQGFDQLHLLHKPPASFTLQPLSNLTIVKVSWGTYNPRHILPEIASLFTRCPNLSKIELSGRLSSTGKSATLGEIFGKVNKMRIPLKIKSLETYGILVSPDDISDMAEHLEHLELLGIIQYQCENGPAALGSIYDTLRQRNLHLKKISTDTASDPGFLSYLASYSGLTNLTIFARKDDSRTADQICKVVLPKHRETLEKLVIRSAIDGAPLWSTFPTDEQLSGLLQCRRFRHLYVAHGSEPDQLQWEGATVFDRWFQVGFQLPNLIHLGMGAQVGPLFGTPALLKMRQEVVQRFKDRDVKFQFG